MTRRASSSIKWINLCISTEKEDLEETMASRLASSMSSFYHKMSLAPIYEAYTHKLEIRMKSEQTSPFRRWGSSSAGGAGGAGAALGLRHRRPGSLLAVSDHDMFSKCTGEAEAREAAAGGGTHVSAWSLGLRQLLSDAAGVACFRAFLEKEHSKENIDFWMECERYRQNSSPALVQQIWGRYLREGAEEPINVDAAVRQATERGLAGAAPDLFNLAQNHVFQLMKLDSYPRFLKSQEHAQCVLAEMQGKPLPYLPAGPASTKLKKSSSNAEERRRGVLARFCHPTRERAPPPQHNNNNNNNHNSLPRRPSLSLERLCRVLLPDSATSVQQVVDGMTVRESIDTLIKNRGIKCSDYEVTVKGDCRPVDLDNKMSTLAGREVVVERRVTLRLLVAGCRPLSARTRPDKTLAEVVASALSYQDCGRRGDVRVMRGNDLVSLATKVEDLENDRLHIHFVPPIREEPTNEQPTQSTSVLLTNRHSSITVRPISTNQGKPACPSLNEITNRVFEEVLHGKSQLQVRPTDNSIKSENNSSSHSSCAAAATGVAKTVVTKICPGDPLQTATTTTQGHLSDYVQCRDSHQRNTRPATSCGIPSSEMPGPIPAARNFTRPKPSPRMSLAKQASPTALNIPLDNAPRTPTSPKSPSSSESGSPRTVEPPPLPPKPKLLPGKAANWGKNVENSLNRMVCVDQPASSCV